MSAAQKGRRKSEEQKRKLSESRKAYYARNPDKKIPISPELRQKLNEGRKRFYLQRAANRASANLPALETDDFELW